MRRAVNNPGQVSIRAEAVPREYRFFRIDLAPGVT
jgi:hypothetical protein